MLPAIRWHHERLDGSGYPDGLQGEEIPLDARILAVADVFDALTSVRPYRAALSVEEALALLRQEAGTRLDPECVAALERLVGRYGVSLVGNEQETKQRARPLVEPSIEHR
uniref:Response regulator receiver protein n=1 Tax=uncultured prokaryote TaxID=198431 RepID=H5SGA8_9ZZZZ|nr:response regulator receiver protein [uncultured prokaryote]